MNYINYNLTNNRQCLISDMIRDNHRTILVDHIQRLFNFIDLLDISEVNDSKSIVNLMFKRWVGDSLLNLAKVKEIYSGIKDIKKIYFLESKSQNPNVIAYINTKEQNDNIYIASRFFELDSLRQLFGLFHELSHKSTKYHEVTDGGGYAVKPQSTLQEIHDRVSNRVNREVKDYTISGKNAENYAYFFISILTDKSIDESIRFQVSDWQQRLLRGTT